MSRRAPLFPVSSAAAPDGSSLLGGGPMSKSRRLLLPIVSTAKRAPTTAMYASVCEMLRKELLAVQCYLDAAQHPVGPSHGMSDVEQAVVDTHRAEQATPEHQLASLLSLIEQLQRRYREVANHFVAGTYPEGSWAAPLAMAALALGGSPCRVVEAHPLRGVLRAMANVAPPTDEPAAVAPPTTPSAESTEHTATGGGGAGGGAAPSPAEEAIRRPSRPPSPSTPSIDSAPPLSAEATQMLSELGMDWDTADDPNSVLERVVRAYAACAEEAKSRQRMAAQQINILKHAASAREAAYQRDVQRLAATLAEREVSLRSLMDTSSSTSNNNGLWRSTEGSQQRSVREMQQLQHMVTDARRQLDESRSSGDLLQASVVSLRADLERAQARHIDDTQTIKTLQEEVRNLSFSCEGLKHARAEESRMSASAMQQLLERVDALERETKNHARERDNVMDALRLHINEYGSAIEELHKISKQLQATRDELTAHRAVYGPHIVRHIERLSRDLFDAHKRNDEQEALLIVLREKLSVTKQVGDAARSALSLTMDSFRQSSEWKVLSLRFSDELKQLSARLDVLVREATKALSQREERGDATVAARQAKAKDEIELRDQRRKGIISTLPTCASAERELSELIAAAQRERSAREILAVASVSKSVVDDYMRLALSGEASDMRITDFLAAGIERRNSQGLFSE